MISINRGSIVPTTKEETFQTALFPRIRWGRRKGSRSIRIVPRRLAIMQIATRKHEEESEFP